MPAIQTTYGARMRPGLPGMIRNEERWNAISRTIEENAGVGFGLPVVQGVAGVIAVGSAVFTAAAAIAAGATGNGTITGVPTTGIGVRRGRYLARALSPTDFEVIDPDGNVIGAAATGQAFAGPVGFTITAGATPFEGGDTFNIDVDSTAGGGVFRGITVRDITLVTTAGQTVDRYQKGNTASILNDGVIWVTFGGVIRPTEPAFFNVGAQRFTNNRADFPLPNCMFDSAGGNGDLGLLRVSAF